MMGNLHLFMFQVCWKCVFREIAVLFNISESTFFVLCERVMDYFMSICKDVIKFPKTLVDLTNLSEAFEAVSGFPNVIGCIDGCYINIRTPAHKIKSTYVNRHQTALTLQAICDANKKFIGVFTGVSSKIHDSRVFSYSFISQEIPQICSINGIYRFHLLGDSAYPLTPYLLTPYRDYGNLTPAQRAFNHRFSSTRVLIENSYGLLKARFRQLIRTDFHSVEKTSKFIICCCVLHNFCIDQGDIWEDLYEELEEDIPFDQQRGLLRQLGEQKRNAICRNLNR